jgi:uncharacterized pyridoxal phosphate-dependent enzyme
MIGRRTVLKLLSSLPFGGLIAAGIPAGGSRAAAAGRLTGGPAPESIYATIGVRPLINARGTVTIIGATRMLPEVQEAMDAATREYVQLDELMEGVGRRLAERTGAEWGIVTSGASGAITVATAGAVTGGDPDRLWRLPDLTGMKDEVIIPSYSRSAYDAAARAVGVRMVEVDDLQQLVRALGPRTAIILVLAGRRSENGPLSVEEIASAARPHGVPILVDAAAEGLEVPNPHLAQGADMVAYSGGKYLRGPQCAGLLLGREDLVRSAWTNSAPHHGFGRSLKVGREEIMGMLAAVEMWFERDHEAEWRAWETRLQHIGRRLQDVPGVSTSVRQPEGRSNRAPSLVVEWDQARIPLTGSDVEQLLWDGEPRIAVSGMGSFLPFPPNTLPDIRINPSQLEAGAELIIADRVFAVLSDPPERPRPSGPPDADVSGQWDLEMTFAAGMADQRFAFEQAGSVLAGTHFADMGPRDLQGTLHGSDILVRSSNTDRGMRINYTFVGTVEGEVMSGRVHMGEYGMAGWRAARLRYDR